MTVFGAPIENVGRFTVTFVAATLGLMAFLFLLDTLFGLDGGASGTWIVPLAVATVFAGQSYAAKHDWAWTPQDRRRLATAYSVVTVILGAIVTIVSVLVEPSALGGLPPIWTVLLFVLGSAFGGLIAYWIALALLVYGVRPKAARNVTNSSQGERTK